MAYYCEQCGEDVSGSSHYHCANCGDVCGMMGHMTPAGNFSCKAKFRGVVVTEGQVGDLVGFGREEEFEAYRKGLVDGANLYGAGSCWVYTKDDDMGDLPPAVAAAVIAKLN